MMLARALIVAVLALAGTASALGQTPVPADCAPLAAREGFPTDVLTDMQLARAKARMAKLNRTDPLVVSCRAAIQSEKPRQNDTAADQQPGNSTYGP